MTELTAKRQGFLGREGAALEGGSERVLIVARRKGIKKLQHAKECEMQSTNVYLGLLRERGKRGLPLNRV